MRSGLICRTLGRSMPPIMRGWAFSVIPAADAERLGPHSEHKFSPAFNFGYLLVSDTNGNFYSSVVNEFKLNPSIQGSYLRINEKDKALHDNVGSIRVCTQQVLW
jgi:hypothetical protein